MLKNAAEHLFMEVLSEFPVIERNGITHSDEYYETLLDDTNLPDGEKTEALANVRLRAKDEVERLERERCRIVGEIAPYEDKEILAKAIKREQRAAFIYRTTWLTAIMFLVSVFVIFIVVSDARVKLGTNLMVVCILYTLVLSYSVALFFSNKSAIYDDEEAFFLSEIDEKKRKIQELDDNILNLNRLEKFAERVLRLDNDLD